MVARGILYKEIGNSLKLSERTIKYHMEHIFDLLQVENRAQAIAYLASQKEKKHD
jgi:two-component system NarL family response regulator